MVNARGKKVQRSLKTLRRDVASPENEKDEGRKTKEDSERGEDIRKKKTKRRSRKKTSDGQEREDESKDTDASSRCRPCSSSTPALRPHCRACRKSRRLDSKTGHSSPGTEKKSFLLLLVSTNTDRAHPGNEVAVKKKEEDDAWKIST